MSLSDALPPSLNLPPHLSAHKYFFVCTLTVAAWDTLVLSPRTWRLLKTKEWPVLKIIFHFLRLFMPAEFIIVAVAFFDTKFSLDMCNKFYLFEPICTAILVSFCSLVHVIRVHAIYDKSRAILGALTGLLGLQVVVMAVCCAFYRVMPLLEGQGCIAGPRFDHNWVGVYWLAPTLFYTTSFILALQRSLQSLPTKPLSAWKLMLRDGLNLYAAIWIVNMINMLFWFISKPTDNTDTIKTIVTSMTAVLTTTMTLRIILSIRGPLNYGGSFNGGSSTAQTNSHSLGASGTHRSGPHVLSGPPRSQTGNGVIAITPSSRGLPTYTIGKEERSEWVDDGKSSVQEEGKDAYGLEDSAPVGLGRGAFSGVKVTIDRHVDEGL